MPQTHTTIRGKRVAVRYEVRQGRDHHTGNPTEEPVFVSVHGTSGDDINITEQLNDAELNTCDRAMWRDFCENLDRGDEDRLHAFPSKT